MFIFMCAACVFMRVQKVRNTMARIKVVLGERARAQAAFEADEARLAKVTPAEAKKDAAATTVVAKAAKSKVRASFKHKFCG